MIHLSDLSIINSSEKQSTLHKSSIIEGSPLGFPAEDYYRFYFGLQWLNLSFPIPEHTLNHAQKAFERVYKCYPSLITPQAYTYFSLYWQL